MAERITPIERAIRETSDRRYKYEKSMRDAGFQKTSMWVPVDALPDVRLLVKLLGSTNGNYRAALKALCAGKFPSGGGE